MLPETVKDYFPDIYVEKDEDSMNALVSVMDQLISDIEEDIREIGYSRDPVRANALVLDELGYWLSANINDFNSEMVKRKKIQDAIRTHKLRSTWETDAKLKIDNYVGGDSKIIISVGTDDWILVGDGSTPTDYYWAAMGADGIDDGLGISLIGDGTEIEIKGNIYIDVDDSTLTADQVEELKQELDDTIPAYYRIFLGYISAGQFITYANGIINP